MAQATKVNVGDNATAAQYNALVDDSKGGSFLHPHQQATPNMTLKIEAGQFYIGATRVVYAGGNTPTFTAPTTNPRIDLVTIDSAGTLAITQGTEAASPTAPAYPDDKIVICEVYNRVGETSIKDTSDGVNGYVLNDTRRLIALARKESHIVFDTSAGHNHDGVNSRIIAVPPAGTVVLWSTNTAPTGYLLCDGAAVSRTTYADLFAVIGTTYGAGDGSTTFNLPNLKGRVPVGRDAAQTEFDALGETGGAKTHTLTTSEMPAHSHNIPLRDQAGGANQTSSAQAAGGSWNASTDSVGGGQAHNNLQPYIALNYIIKF